MPVIIKNGKTYGDRSVTLSKAEYDALSSAEKLNGTVYYIYDSNENAGIAVELTQAEYDALVSPDPDIVYYIIDGSVSYPTADDMRYEEGVSVADALDTLTENLNNQLTIERKEMTFGQCSPNVDYSQTMDISKTGYAAVGIIGYQILGTYGTHFHASHIDISSYVNAVIKIRANSTLTFTTDNTRVSFVVLYKKRY